MRQSGALAVFGKVEKTLILVSLLLAVTACGGGPGRLTSSKLRTADGILAPNDKIDLLNLIDPERRRAVVFERDYDCGKPVGSLSKNAEYQHALRAFETYYLSKAEFEDVYGTGRCAADQPGFWDRLTSSEAAKRAAQRKGKAASPDQINDYLPDASGENFSSAERYARRAAESFKLAVLRNEIQDALITQGQAECSYFKRVVSDTSTVSDFALGSLGTSLQALATAFTDAPTTRALTAAAGVSSGVQNEISATYLQQQAVSTILAGIQLRQEEIRAEIDGKRFHTVSEKLESTDASPNGIDVILTSAARRGAISFPDVDHRFLAANSADLPSARRIVWGERLSSASSGGQRNGVVYGITRATAETVTAPRQKLIVSTASYSLSAALTDTLRFVDACSIASGLAEAEDSITRQKTVLEARANSPAANGILGLAGHNASE